MADIEPKLPLEPPAAVNPPAAVEQASPSPELIVAGAPSGGEAAPIAEAKPAPVAAEEPFKHHSEEPSLLETATKPVDAAKPGAEAQPGDKPGEKPVVAAPEQPAPAAEAPVEYKYTLPETLKLDDPGKAEVHKLFDEFRSNPAENVQKLVDYHAKAMNDYAEGLEKDTLRRQNDAFRDTRKGWTQEVMSDPELGGSKHQTAMAAVARMRDLLVPKEMMEARQWPNGQPRMSQFEEFLRVTGAGDHPAFLRVLHNAARFFDEPQANQLPTEIKPSPTNGKAPGSRSLYAPRPSR